MRKKGFLKLGKHKSFLSQSTERIQDVIELSFQGKRKNFQLARKRVELLSYWNRVT